MCSSHPCGQGLDTICCVPKRTMGRTGKVGEDWVLETGQPEKSIWAILTDMVKCWFRYSCVEPRITLDDPCGSLLVWDALWEGVLVLRLDLLVIGDPLPCPEYVVWEFSIWNTVVLNCSAFSADLGIQSFLSGWACDRGWVWVTDRNVHAVGVFPCLSVRLLLMCVHRAHDQVLLLHPRRSVQSYWKTCLLFCQFLCWAVSCFLSWKSFFFLCCVR